MSERFETVSMSVFEWVLEACLRQNLSPEEVKVHAHHLAEIRRRCMGVSIDRVVVEAVRKDLVSADSELSAQGHGRPASSKEELLAISAACRESGRKLRVAVAEQDSKG